MKQSRTLPRRRPSEAPPPVPTRFVSVNRILDVHRLKDEIDKLSQQLLMVKAQLDIRLNDQPKLGEYNPSRFEENALDSRLSTILCSPSDIGCSPSPQPTKLTLPTACSASIVEKPLSSSSSKNFTEAPESKRASLCANPAGATTIPRISRRETFSHLGFVSEQMLSYPNPSKDRSLVAGSLDNVTAPPKPLRTFTENVGNPQKPWHEELIPTNTFDGKTATILCRCSDEKFLEMILQKFPHGSCWYMKDGRLFFVNPFSDISSSKRKPCPAISTISSSLLRQKAASLILRGISGSGKSQIAELVCLDLVRRLCPEGTVFSILHATFVALRPFLTVNSKQNNQSSTALAHVEFCIRNGRLLCIRLNHFMLDSPSRGCRANIFAMLANDLEEHDKEKYLISGFQLKDNHQEFGSIADLSSALTELGISVSDVFKANDFLGLRSMVTSACILLNNLSFKEINDSVDVENLSDLEDASILLGVSALAMYRAIMRCTLTGKSSIRECQISRDQLVSAIYTRIVRKILMRANISLQNIQDLEDTEDMKGNNKRAPSESQVIHVVDAPGYVCNKTNSLSELLINTINDSLAGYSTENISDLLQKIELSSKSESSSMRRRSTATVLHCNRQFEVNYEFNRMQQRNENVVARELVFLFDARSCAFQFVVKLFASDVDRMNVDECMEPVSLTLELDNSTLIQNVLEHTNRLQQQLSETTVRHCVCLKSNDRLEYCRIQKSCISKQLCLFKITPSNESRLESSWAPLPEFPSPANIRCAGPTPRRYEVRDRKKHEFPQRRNVIVDFHDQNSGAVLHAGDVVKAMGFIGDAYIVETGRRVRAVIPISYTEKSLPPTEGYNV